ncbi:MAG: hypothetical protein KAR80_03915 [Rhodospirillaceae bacterium]|nr:hypothetical protein [Rhodospirillaceae bacterium]
MSLSEQSEKTAYKRPFLRLLAGQAAAGALVVLLDMASGWWIGPGVGVGAGVGLEVWVLVALQATLAFIISLFLGLGRGWAAAQFFLPWATWGALYLDIPSWVYLICFILTYAIYRNVGAERVPLYLSNRTTWLALESLINDSGKKDGRFIDLGSGLGGTISHLGAKYPAWKFEGIESAPLVFVVLWLRTLIGGRGSGQGNRRGNVSVRFGDMWNTDLGKYNVVYAFLSPAPMERLLKKAIAEMRPGSIFISNSFWADEASGMAFDECIELTDSRATKLYIKKI